METIVGRLAYIKEGEVRANSYEDWDLLDQHLRMLYNNKTVAWLYYTVDGDEGEAHLRNLKMNGDPKWESVHPEKWPKNLLRKTLAEYNTGRGFMGAKLVYSPRLNVYAIRRIWMRDGAKDVIVTLFGENGGHITWSENEGGMMRF